MLIKNISILQGKDLNFVPRIDVRIQKNKFEKIQSELKQKPHEKILDGSGLLLLPGFINAHTHIGDSIGKDFTINTSVDQRIHPVFGIKSRSSPCKMLIFLINMIIHKLQVFPFLNLEFLVLYQEI